MIRQAAGCRQATQAAAAVEVALQHGLGRDSVEQYAAARDEFGRWIASRTGEYLSGNRQQLGRVPTTRNGRQSLNVRPDRLPLRQHAKDAAGLANSLLCRGLPKG